MTLHSLKKSIHHALESNDLETIVSLVRKDRKVLTHLVRFAYEKDTLVGWRAIKAVGLAARELVKTDYEFLRETARKLLWSLSDESGSIGWAAPEMLGEIVSADPKRFSDLVPLIAELYDVEEEVFRPGVLYALVRIASIYPEAVMPYKELIIKALSDPDPAVKIHALGLVKSLTKSSGGVKFVETVELRSLLKNMVIDRGEAWIYQGDDFVNAEVGETAREVLKTTY